MKVLLIASTSGHCMDIKKWLEESEIEVITIHSCRQSRKIVENDVDIDLIILDALAAEDYGLKFLRWIKGDQRLRVIPIIVAGKNITEELVEQYLQLGTDDILLLPNSKTTIEAKIAKYESHGRPTILLVDDEPGILDILSDFLRLNRYQCLKASSAEEALTLLKEKSIDAVVTDILLPGKTGIDLLEMIKEDNPYMPVILITGFSGKFTPKDAINMGADGFFSKPFNNIELSYKLRLILSQKRGHHMASMK